jgi:hypothetical protein
MNHIERARNAADNLNTQISDLMDLAGVPDESDTGIKASRAIGEIYEILEDIPRSGRTASFIFDEGPKIYVNPNQDIRDWPTSNGRKAGSGNPRTAALSKRQKVTASGPILSRRVITAALYNSIIEEAIEASFELVEA